MRPSVPLPTGTVIGWPVFVAMAPRRTPSVADMATQRTQLLPSCCWTSSVMACPSLDAWPSELALPAATFGSAWMMTAL